MGHLLDALERAYRVLGLEDAAGGDEVFRQLVLARIIEPASKLDSLRVLEEAGVAAASYRDGEAAPAGLCEGRAGGSGCRRRAPRTPGWARPAWSSTTCPRCISRPTQGDGFRERGFSKERRLEPQITIGLLTGQDGFPLMVSAFEGNRAETKTMLPVIEAFMAAHDLPDVTVVADAGMVSEANQKAIEAAGLSFILGMRIPHVPYVVAQWRREHPGEDIPDGHMFTQPWPAGPTAAAGTRSSTTSTGPTGPAGRCAASTSRSPRPSKAVAGKRPVKRNRFIQPRGGSQERQPRAGGQGQGPGRAEGLRHQPRGLPRRHPRHRGVRDRRLPPALPDREIFRMAKSDLQARPIYHRKRDSIEAHLTIVFAALAVSRWIEAQTGWSIRKFVKTARRYRTIEIQAGTADHHRRRPSPRRPPPSPRSHHPRQPRCALV